MRRIGMKFALWWIREKKTFGDSFLVNGRNAFEINSADCSDRRCLKDFHRDYVWWNFNVDGKIRHYLRGALIATQTGDDFDARSFINQAGHFGDDYDHWTVHGGIGGGFYSDIEIFGSTLILFLISFDFFILPLFRLLRKIESTDTWSVETSRKIVRN